MSHAISVARRLRIMPRPRAVNLDALFPDRVGSPRLRERVKPTQLRFWPDPQPVVDALGRAFFRQVPEAPGVYLMYGSGNSVLYVGKARNLRHRLASYRVANPDRLPRRLLRLLYQVERIVWETCCDEESALRREAELLLRLKPRFNRLGVWPKPVRFLLWRESPNGLELALAKEADSSWRQAGPPGPRTRRIYGALVRLVWLQLQPQLGLAGMPNGWFRGDPGPQVAIPRSQTAPANAGAEFLTQLTSGDCDGARNALVPVKTAFEQSVREEDFALVAGHFAPQLQT